MNAENFNLKQLLQMAHSPVCNYAVPGLTSSLIGERSARGTIRLFECSREHHEPIVPHSHRFDFQCWVLSGSVRNLLWRQESVYSDCDKYMVSDLRYEGGFGKYEQVRGGVFPYSYSETVYKGGECYSMKSDQVHSIYFGRGAKVLFFEGPTVSDKSIILEPFVDGAVVPTFKVEPWMFRRGE